MRWSWRLDFSGSPRAAAGLPLFIYLLDTRVGSFPHVRLHLFFTRNDIKICISFPKCCVSISFWDLPTWLCDWPSKSGLSTLKAGVHAHTRPPRLPGWLACAPARPPPPPSDALLCAVTTLAPASFRYFILSHRSLTRLDLSGLFRINQWLSSFRLPAPHTFPGGFKGKRGDVTSACPSAPAPGAQTVDEVLQAGSQEPRTWVTLC